MNKEAKSKQILPGAESQEQQVGNIISTTTATLKAEEEEAAISTSTSSETKTMASHQETDHGVVSSPKRSNLKRNQPSSGGCSMDGGSSNNRKKRRPLIAVLAAAGAVHGPPLPAVAAAGPGRARPLNRREGTVGGAVIVSNNNTPAKDGCICEAANNDHNDYDDGGITSFEALQDENIQLKHQLAVANERFDETTDRLELLEEELELYKAQREAACWDELGCCSSSSDDDDDDDEDDKCYYFNTSNC